MLSLRFLLVSAFFHSLYESTAGADILGLSELKTEDIEYDFIIAGGGTAGLVVANRLSENPKVKVLVIEAGPSHENILDLQVPFFSYKLTGDVSPFAWNTTTTPQKGLLGRTITYPRGFVLGGSSTHNSMFWVRGTREDYDRWANITGDHGWSWNSLLPYMKKIEKWSPSSETPGFDQGKFDPSVHGFDGPLGVGITGLVRPVDNLMVQVLESDEFNLTMVDANAGESLGYWWMQSSIANGTRTSSATAYLDPIRDRPNLTVLINTYVTKISQTREGVFTTLEAAESPTGPRKTFVARKEIILSAGVVGSPQILLNSGIGDSNELKAVGVTPTHDLPNVGKGLSNQPESVSQWKANTIIPDLKNNATLLQEQLDLWNFNRTGFLLTLVATIISFHRLPEDSALLKNTEDPTAGPNTPHYWLAATASPYFSTGANPLVTVTGPVAEPNSRGSVTLKSNDSFVQPNVDLGFYNTDLDIGIALQAFKTTEAQMTHPIMSGFTMDRVAPPMTAMTDEAIIQFIRNTTRSASHGIGTAAMSAKGSKEGVVDPDLKVKGIEGVRVVDASVMPFNPQANTQASVYIVAERASDLIKKHWKI